jgi:hypothetical protein
VWRRRDREAIDRDFSREGGPTRQITLTPAKETACRVTICAQSPNEVSFFLPSDWRECVTVDLWAKESDWVLERARQYARAVIDGALEIEVRRNGGDATLFLDGESVVHRYRKRFRPPLDPRPPHRFDAY